MRGIIARGEAVECGPFSEYRINCCAPANSLLCTWVGPRRADLRGKDTKGATLGHGGARTSLISKKRKRRSRSKTSHVFFRGEEDLLSPTDVMCVNTEHTTIIMFVLHTYSGVYDIK